MKAIFLRTRAHHCYIIGTNQMAINTCPYDNEPSCEPFIKEMKEESEV